VSDTVTLSKADLDRLISQAAAGGTPAAQLANPAPTEPEPEFTFADVIRTLIHFGRLPDENLQRKCLAAVDKEYPAAVEATPESKTEEKSDSA